MKVLKMFNSLLNYKKNSISELTKMFLLKDLVNRVKNLARKANRHGRQPRNNRKNKRSRRSMICSNLPTSLTMISIWKTKRLSLPLKSLRIVLTISRKTRTGRSRWPRSGTKKLDNRTRCQWILPPKCRPDLRDKPTNKVYTHTVSKQTFSFFNSTLCFRI